MPGYFEMFVTMRDHENSDAMYSVVRFILAHADNPEFVSIAWDKILCDDVGLTMTVPDEHQFDRLLNAFHTVSTTNERTLFSLVCYRGGHQSEHALADDEISIEYFNHRPGYVSSMMNQGDKAVRLTHRSTGMVAISTESRRPHDNLHIARQMLNAKLAEKPSALLLSKRSIEGLNHYPLQTPTR